MGLFQKLFGTSSQREVKSLEPTIQKIEALEEQFRGMSEEELRGQTEKLRARHEGGETLDALLPEAFATMREAAHRVLGMRPYRVQLIGGMILHQGRIAEMKTGEGKTLVATLPAYLNALTGRGVHIVTVNDYLARRDSEWMGKVYRYLGLTVGLVVHGLKPDEKRAAYLADITYGTNNEYGFDYLRDNMAVYEREVYQRGHAFAIVDEVDSILVDEARTPLIISGMGEQSTQLYGIVDAFVGKLKCMTVASVDNKEEEAHDIDADYIVDEKARTVTLTARGIEKAEAHFQIDNLGDPEHSTTSHHINQAIRARGLMKRDIDYVVKDGEVIIVDEYTGRLMNGRRYSDGLHQAIEAKERVTVARESKTLATITFQNYFRLYEKLSGMTGTAMTESEEFGHTYSLDIVEIPTNRPIAREDQPDVVYKNEPGKYRAIVKQIALCHENGQPVLVGTVSIEMSELISKMLTKAGIKHNVLNAKNHEKEAEIVAQAGKLGAVTVATNMAGRGTDIMLGGNAEYLAKAELRRAGLSEELIVEATGFGETDNEEILDARARYSAAEEKHKSLIEPEAEKVKQAGGLFILGTERHESRRIDNQLRGRAGRQGDPGKTRFYLSLEDDIMRLFGSDRVKNMMERLDVDEDTPIDAKILSGAIENAQKKVESRHFQSRKSVLEYDDVMNTQRSVIYKQRKQVLAGQDMRESIMSMIRSFIESHVQSYEAQHSAEERSERAILEPFLGLFLLETDLANYAGQSGETLIESLITKAEEVYAAKEAALNGAKEANLTKVDMREVERIVMLKCVDEYWMDHIDAMNELKQGISLRAYAQSNPVNEYKREGFDMFEAMITAIQEETVRRIFRARVQASNLQRERVARVTGESGGGETVARRVPVRKAQKIGPNEPCPCGSGKKFKKCDCETYHKKPTAEG